jgi:pimeloyl-ACP methyl ester carboxylesterase
MKGTMMSDLSGTVEYVEVGGGRIAYDVTGDGPLVVLSPGMVDIRSTYRFLAPLLVNAGYRVARVDLRGHGDSSTGWDSYTHADTASDLIAVIQKLGGPAVIVGQSFSGGATTIAAATHPELVSAIVEIDPFTRPVAFSFSGMFTNGAYRRGSLLLGQFIFTGSLKTWMKYLNVAYPGRKPADWDSYRAALQSNLSEPGRVKAAQKMISSSATLKQAASLLPDIKCPALVIMGSADSDFAAPEAEAKTIVGLIPAGLGQYTMIKGAGHYPHAEYPQEVASAIIPFLAENHHA